MAASGTNNARTTNDHRGWTRFVAQHGPDLPTRGVSRRQSRGNEREAGGSSRWTRDKVEEEDGKLKGTAQKRDGVGVGCREQLSAFVIEIILYFAR